MTDLSEKLVVAVSGSPRPQGNTVQLARHALGPAEEAGLQTELISLAGKDIRGCQACGWCRDRKESEAPRCKIEDDFGPVFERMLAADALLLGSPVYFGSATPEIKATIDRAGFAGRDAFRRKVGAPFTVARRAGQNYTFAQLMYFFMICDMIVPGSSYWNVAFGLKEGSVREDEEGLQTIEHLGENVVWLLDKLS